jgi:hypothetical protein
MFSLGRGSGRNLTLRFGFWRFRKLNGCIGLSHRLSILSVKWGDRILRRHENRRLSGGIGAGLEVRNIPLMRYSCFACLLHHLALNFLAIFEACSDIEGNDIAFAEPFHNAYDFAVIVTDVDHSVVDFTFLVDDGDDGVIALDGKRFNRDLKAIFFG